jgi:hypothetical protein
MFSISIIIKEALQLVCSVEEYLNPQVFVKSDDCRVTVKNIVCHSSVFIVYLVGYLLILNQCSFAVLISGKRCLEMNAARLAQLMNREEDEEHCGGYGSVTYIRQGCCFHSL